MKKIFNNCIRAVKIRPLCAICIFIIISALILEKNPIKNEKQIIYQPDANNIFTLAQIKEWDNVTLVGKVSAMDRDNLCVVLKAVETRDGEMLTLPYQSISVYLSDSYEIYMGQRIRVKGRLVYHKRATNPGEFSRYEYNRARGNLFKLYEAEVEKTGRDYAVIRQRLYEVRCLGEKRIEEKLSPENAGIIKAMLFGNKGDIDVYTKELFQKSGVAHILAISGLHISFLAMGLFKLLRRMGLGIVGSVTVSEFALILYGIMIGFSVSSFRAIVMFSLYLFGKVIFRSYDILTSLSFALSILILFNPSIIRDVGLQLSFGAVLGVGYFYNSYIKKVYKPPKVLSPLFISLFVFLSTLPIIISSYYEANFYSIFLNLLIIPLMSILLVSAILVLTPLSVLGVPVAESILWIYRVGCEVFDSLGAGRYNIGGQGVIHIIAYYSLIILAVNMAPPYTKEKSADYKSGGKQAFKGTQIWNILCSFLFVFLAILILIIHIPGNLHIWMLDVGQGDGMVIRNKNGSVYMIDGGSLSKKEVGKYCIIPMLKYYGINEMEAVFLTHPDADHMNGIEELIEKQAREHIKIRKIYVFKGFMEEDGFSEIFNKAYATGIEVIGISGGDIICNGNLRIEVLHPAIGFSTYSGNDASLVMDIGYKDFHLLTTGDVEAVGEKAVTDEYGNKSNAMTTYKVEYLEPDKSGIKTKIPSRCGVNFDILKVAHHGSKSSTGEEFIEWAKPDVALVSVGKNNYGHPSLPVLERLQAYDCTILRTDEVGCIEIIVDRRGYRCKGFVKQ